MNLGAAVALFTLLAVFVVSARPAAGEDPSSSAAEASGRARQAAVLRVEAAALRDQARRPGDGEGDATANVRRARQLERRADELDQQADRIDPPDAPPAPKR